MERTVVVLPRLVRLGSIVGLRFPFFVAFLIVMECSSAGVLLGYVDVLPVAVHCTFLALCGFVLLCELHAGWSIWRSGILGDLVDLVGENESKPCFARAGVEVWGALVPAVATGTLPAAVYFSGLHGQMEKKTAWQNALIYTVITFLTVAGPFLSLSFMGGHIVLVRLVSNLLKRSIGNYFSHLEATLTSDGLSPEESIEKISVHCRHVKQLFDKANDCITAQIFATVLGAYLVALSMMIQLVITLRSENHSTVIVILSVGLGVTVTFLGTALLYSLTSVADCYEDFAADLSHNVALRFKLTNAFPGPAGVKLLSNFEGAFVNDLSFHFHHKPLDARVLEATLLRMFLGAVLTVVLGILT